MRMALTPDQEVLSKRISDKHKSCGSDLSLDDYFEYFCSECLLNEYGISADQIINGIVDGSGDRGIDSIFCFLNNNLVIDESPELNHRFNSVELIIIQSKNTNSFTEPPIMRLENAVLDIINFDKSEFELRKRFRESAAKKILRFRDLVKRTAAKNNEISIKIYYCSKGQDPHVDLLRLKEDSTERLREKFRSAAIEFHLLGAPELLKLNRKINMAQTLSLKLAEASIAPEDGGYIGLVKIWDYLDFIKHDGNINQALFDANVRDWQKESEVNDEIKDTIKAPGEENFWWLNNGVSIIASRVTPRQKHLVIENPQVVNGLQTSYQIYSQVDSSDHPSANHHILVRIVEIDDENKLSRDKIIRATNSQTKIPLFALRSTDKIHRDIEEYFLGNNLYYDRRSRFYHNQEKPIDRIVSILYLTQSMGSILRGQPHTAIENPSSFLKNQTEYDKIFRNIQLKTYFNAIFIMKVVEKHLRENPFEYGVENIKFHLAYVYTGLSIRSTNINDISLSGLNIMDLDIDLLHKAYKLVKKEFTKHLKSGLDASKVSVSDTFTIDCRKMILANY